MPPEISSWLEWALALVGAGGAVKAMDSLLSHLRSTRKQEEDRNLNLRGELWGRVGDLEERVQNLQEEKDEWQELYAETKSQNALLKQENENLRQQNTTLTQLKNALERENERLHARLHQQD